ncbi:baseplate J/gp47 family protein [Pedobacter ureilyticus]|uniref:Baseplate J/gp47 family protein n=1 Tax=Pedobacter ureilyticus TaxID=1393051 RepID=A0ABW9J3B1_9SPHI|nr:baseplate J/gp47 family protein [Pedobacter helvus]
MKPIPSTVELQNRLSADITAQLEISDVGMKRVIDTISAVLAGELKLAYLYLQDIQNNVFPDTADLAIDGGELNRIGQIQLNRQPRPATSGIYKVSVDGEAASVLKAGLTFKSNSESKSPGNLYILEQDYILTGTDDEIILRSLDAGPDFILEEEDTLTATEPLIGVDQIATILEVTTQPTAAESIELYRKNVIDAIRLEAQGGARTDYRLWSADAQGVERVFPYVKIGEAGTVQVFLEATVTDSIDGNGTPSAALINEVIEVITQDPDITLPTNQRGRLPIGVVLEVLPVVTKPVDIEIIGLQNDTPSVRSSISSNMKDFLFTVRPYIAGTDLSRDKNDVLTAVKAQAIVSDTVGNANTFTDFKIYVDGVEQNTYSFSGGIIPYLRNVTYL